MNLLHEGCSVATVMTMDESTSVEEGLLNAWHDACERVSASPAGSFVSGPTKGAVVGSFSRLGRRSLNSMEFFQLTEALDRLTTELAGHRPTLGSAPDRSFSNAVDILDDGPLLHSLRGAHQATAAEGVARFHQGDYEASLQCFINLSLACLANELTPALIDCIAVCQYKLERWELAEKATQRAMSMERATAATRSSRRLVRIYLAEKKIEAAMALTGPKRGAQDWKEEVALVKAYREYDGFFQSHQYVKALPPLEKALELFPCSLFELAKSELLALESVIDAANYISARLPRYPFSVDLLYQFLSLRLRGATTLEQLNALLVDFSSRDPGKAEARFRLGVQQSRRCIELLTATAALHSRREWGSIIDLSTETIKATFLPDGVKGVMYAERCEAFMQNCDWYAALDDAYRSLHYAEGNAAKARLLLLVARCEEPLRRFKDALHHAEESRALCYSDATSQYILHLRSRINESEKAKSAQSNNTGASSGQRGRPKQQRGGRPPQGASSSGAKSTHGGHQTSPVAPRVAPYYHCLSLTVGADAAQVKKTYRALAMQWHPDRWCGASAVEKKKAETKFKEIQNAYEELMIHLDGILE